METIRHLLPPVQQYFKANLHAHSNLSDGFLSPQELKDAYKAKGCSILCITDHDVVVDHSPMNEADFLLLTGAEFDMSAWLDLCQGLPHDWLRIVVQGPYGHTATTRAYTPDELRPIG